MTKDIYLLATQIQRLCGMDQYDEPPQFEGVTHAIVAMLRQYDDRL